MSSFYLQTLLDRQLSGKTASTCPFYQHFTTDAPCAGVINANPEGITNPPFACKFGQTQNAGNLLALADEEGYITFLDTRQTLPQSLFTEEEWGAHRPPKQQWMAHRNAIFDICWIKDDQRMLTGSGDQAIGLWDVERPIALSRYQGHIGSVKTIDCNPANKDVFASGSRDGSIFVWDMRSAVKNRDINGVGIHHAVMSIPKAQSPSAVAAAAAPKPKRCNSNTQPASRDSRTARAPGRARRPRGGPEPRISVTAVKFLQSGYALLSGGASEDVVRYWDIRQAGQPLLHIQPTPPEAPWLASTTSDSHQGLPEGSRHYGVTSIVEDPDGARIVVSYVNNMHCCYSAYHPHKGPLYSFGSFAFGSFYVKTAMSPDGNHILAGSSDCKGRIWQVDAPTHAPYTLEGHESEVTCVAWCPTDPCKVATCGDDCTVRVWQVSMPQPQTSPRRKAEPSRNRLQGLEDLVRQYEGRAPVQAQPSDVAMQDASNPAPALTVSLRQPAGTHSTAPGPSQGPAGVSASGMPGQAAGQQLTTPMLQDANDVQPRRVTPPPNSIQRSLLEFVTATTRPQTTSMPAPSEACSTTNRLTAVNPAEALLGHKRKLPQAGHDENKPPN